MEKDKELLELKFKGLLNSKALKIEEKGYILQLLHSQDMRDALSDMLSEFTSGHQI